MPSNNYRAKVRQADSDNGDSGDRCIKKCPAFYGKGQKHQWLSDSGRPGEVQGEFVNACVG